jgi:hypothetical protein
MGHALSTDSFGLASAAERWYEAGGSAVEFIQRAGSPAWLARARNALGQSAAAAAWEAGRLMSLQAATDAALAVGAT